MNQSIPETMEALVLTGKNEFEVKEMPVPKPLPYEVLIRVRAVAICGSDPKIIRGDSFGTWPPYYPFVVGHEWAGEVVACGEAVSGFAPGDRVAGEAHSGCGVCAKCMKGDYNLCENYGKKETGHRHYGHLSPGVYAQYAVITNRAISKMQDNVSFEEGALVDTAGTAFHVLELTGVTPGGSLAVIGPGPIGLLVGRLGKIFGTGRVIFVGRGGRLDIASRLCADAVVDFEKEEPVAAVRAFAGGKGVDEAVDCSGSKGTLAQAIGMVRRGGKVGLVGIPPQGHLEGVPYRTLVLDQITVSGSRANPNVSKPVLSLISSGKLQVKDMITHRFPLREFKTGLDYFVNRKEGALKVIIQP